jgi:hypothetical protein
MHRQHDADRESSRNNQRGRAIAELIDVPHDFAQLVGRSRRFDDGTGAERRHRPGESEEADDVRAGPIDDRDLRWHPMIRLPIESSVCPKQNTPASASAIECCQEQHT